MKDYSKSKILRTEHDFSFIARTWQETWYNFTNWSTVLELETLNDNDNKVNDDVSLTQVLVNITWIEVAPGWVGVQAGILNIKGPLLSLWSGL